MKDRTGYSQPAIAKSVEAKYKDRLPPDFQKILSVQLKKFAKSERLVKVKNSLKISSTEMLKGCHQRVQETMTKATPKPKEKPAKKISDKGLKTKRLSQIKTPDALKKANKGSDKKKKKPVANGKMKRLSQVKTPEGQKKKKMKNSTPAKRKSAKPADSSSRPTKKVRNGNE